MWEEHEENLRYIKAVSFPEEINQSSRVKCVVPVTLGGGRGCNVLTPFSSSFLRIWNIIIKNGCQGTGTNEQGPRSVSETSLSQSRETVCPSTHERDMERTAPWNAERETVHSWAVVGATECSGGLAVMPIFTGTACGRGQLVPALHWRTTPELIHVGILFPSWCFYAYLYRVVWEEESSRCFLSESSPSQVWWGLKTESGGGGSGHNFSQSLFIEMKVPSASQIKGSQKSGLFFFFLKQREVKFPDF